MENRLNEILGRGNYDRWRLRCLPTYNALTSAVDSRRYCVVLLSRLLRCIVVYTILKCYQSYVVLRGVLFFAYLQCHDFRCRVSSLLCCLVFLDC